MTPTSTGQDKQPVRWGFIVVTNLLLVVSLGVLAFAGLRWGGETHQKLDQMSCCC